MHILTGSTDIWRLIYSRDGNLLVKDHSGSHPVGSFAVGASDHFELYLHLDSDSYNLAINGANVRNGQLMPSDRFDTTYFRSMGRESAEDLAPFAFDNLRVVPEPATLLLLGLGGMALLRRRRHG